MFENLLIEQIKTMNEALKTQSLINKHTLKKINRNVFAMMFIIGGIEYALYIHKKKINKLTKEVEELKRMKGE